MAKIPWNVKQEVLCACDAGQRVADVSKQYNIAKSTIFRWLKDDNATNPGTFKEMSPREIYLMQVELERLRQDNEIFRRSNCTVSASLAEKQKAIKALKDEFSIHALCRVLEVRRSTFYHFLNRSPEKTMIEAEDENFRPIIKELFLNSKERFGARKIQAKMMEDGMTIGTKRINRLMKEMGLVCKQTRLRYTSTTNRKYKYYRNKVKRDFNPGGPNLIWVSDVTYIRVDNNFHYVCIVVDLFARRVLSYGVSSQFDANLVRQTFMKAYGTRDKPSGLTFHSDQGIQYTDFGFRELLRELEVQQSFSHPGVPVDNAVAESFFAIMKREELSHNWYNSQEQLETDVAEFVEYFNHERPHQRLGNKTPVQIEEEFFSH